MAHALSITDGTTTVSLSTTNFMLLQFNPNTPIYRNGSYEPVTESIELNAYGATASASLTVIHSVELLLAAAIRRQERQTGPRVYLNYTIDGGSQYRTEVLNGAVVLGQDAMRSYNTKNMACTLVVEHVPHWEGAETTLLSSQAITNADGSNSYYTASTVHGTLPTPCKISVKNTGLAAIFRHIHIGVNAFNTPASFDGTLGSKTLTITSPTDYGTNQASWTPTGAQLLAMNGDYFRFVAAFTGGATLGVSYRFELEFNATTTVTHTSQVTATTDNYYVMDMGAMAMPAIFDDTAGGSSTITINAYSAATDGSDSLTFVQMFPADNYRHLYDTTTVETNDSIIDDGIEDEAYHDVGSTNRQTVQAHGNPLLLYPGQAHRFSLLTESTSYDATKTQAITVSYRPRRLTV